MIADWLDAGAPRAAAVGVLTGLALLVPAAKAAAAPRQPNVTPRPTQDSVTGSGTVQIFAPDTTLFTVRATSGSSGEAPSGQVTGTTSTRVNTAPITCLAVRGTTATFNAQTGFGLVTFEVTDNGAGATDLYTAFTSDRSPDDCSPVRPEEAPFTTRFLKGGVVVVDASPFPVSKDQCRTGGFERFGFRNQGECIASTTSRSQR